MPNFTSLLPTLILFTALISSTFSVQAQSQATLQTEIQTSLQQFPNQKTRSTWSQSQQQQANRIEQFLNEGTLTDPIIGCSA